MSAAIASPLLRTKREGIQLSAIKEMELLASRIPGVISLAQGIPSFDTPPVIGRRAIAAIREGKVAKYSLVNGLPQLREAIEEHLAASKIYYDFEEEIIVTVGAIEAITATLLAVLEPDDEVILPNPCYVSYPEAVRVAHGVPIWVALNESRGWGLDIAAIKQVITDRTKAIILTNPNNPTGTIFPRSQLLELAELTKQRGILMISDEVYKDIVFEGLDKGVCEYPTLAREREFRENFVYIFSFSKSYAMTGWRIGFLAADAKLATEIRKVHDALVTCAPVVSQYAALAALDLAQSDIAEYRLEYERRRDTICKCFDLLSGAFTYTKPVASYYLFLKILLPHRDAKSFALDLLNQAQVAVVPGSAFGPQGEGHVRVCFARSMEDIMEGMKRINAFVQKTKKT